MRRSQGTNPGLFIHLLNEQRRVLHEDEAEALRRAVQLYMEYWERAKEGKEVAGDRELGWSSAYPDKG